MIKIQGKDYSRYLSSREIQLSRTYVGEIKRTQLGRVADFPISYITVGFSLVFMAPREIIEEIHQICLSANLVELILEYEGVNLKGKFSMTTGEQVEVRDKDERHKQLTISVVSDGTAITKPDGTGFVVTRNETTLTTTAAFGKVFVVEGGGKLNGIPLPTNYLGKAQLLVLGDTALTE